MFPNGHYVLVKRFTAKEEKRRVVACVYEPVDGYDSVAFENHVNVIHRDHAPLHPSEANGLADFLNGDLVDIYFRMFSGSTQVNATDLRRLRFPDVSARRRPTLFDSPGSPGPGHSIVWGNDPGGDGCRFGPGAQGRGRPLTMS